MDSQSATDNQYFVDQERVEEMVRLIRQDRFITASLGGILPEFGSSQTEQFTSILDLACGLGEWVMSLAEWYPHIHIIGLDRSGRMIEYAQAQAEIRLITNAHFQEGDITQLLPFPGRSYDLINIRMVGSILSRNGWMPLLSDCARMLRPGGFLRLMECDIPISNSHAGEQLNDLLALALFKAGKSFHSSRTTGITAMAGSLLEEAGYHDIRLFPRVLQFRAETPEHANLLEIFRFLTLLRPFFLKYEVTTQEHFDDLHIQAIQDMEHPRHYCIWYMMTAIGQK